MKFRKVLAAVAAAAVAVSMTAINAFAATITLDSEYVGAWGAGKCIPKADLEAIGGDVKVVLTIETKEPLVGDHNHLLRPMDYDNSWTEVTGKCQSDTAYAKADGFIPVADGQTSVEFIVPADVCSSLGDSGLGFQVMDVFIKSADISKADAAQGAFKIVTEEESGQIMNGTYGAAAPADEAPAADETPAADEAPAADETPAATTDAAPAAPVADTAATTPAATGNVPAAVMVSVMAVAGAAAIAAKKRK